MITPSKEYYSLLYRIQDPNIFINAYGEPPTMMPKGEETLKIDLNGRTIEAPEFLSVQHDHYAETVFFEVDRYFGEIDLAQMTCIVQYENKTTKKPRIYAVPYYDLTTTEGKIYFPWCISGEATKEAGIVEYSVKFYQVEQLEEDEYRFTYSLNIQPNRSRVLHGMQNATLPEDYDVNAEFELYILNYLQELKQANELYWLEVQ